MSKTDKKRIAELEERVERFVHQSMALQGQLIHYENQAESLQKIADDYKEEALKWKAKYIEQIEKNLALAKEIEGRSEDESSL